MKNSRSKPLKKINHRPKGLETDDFRKVVTMIQDSRHRTLKAVNTELISLYWRVGEYISLKISSEGWGKNTVVELSHFIQKRDPEIRGFSPQNLWRMRQFFETYRGQPKLSTLLRELPWSSNLHILTKTKTPAEREFYLRMAKTEGWQVRELARQIDSSLFERAILNPPKVSAALRQLHPAANEAFKDSYLIDFLNLPDGHSERDLEQGLVTNLRRFLIELGSDFAFVGEQVRLQVGGKDFALDLLFFHRGLNCLVAIELKIDEFQPEYLGKLEFYLEALDRDMRKPHEKPSIGVLLCATKDNEVVEYALSRSTSPALIAEYQTKLPDKKLLQRKLHEFYQLASPQLK